MVWSFVYFVARNLFALVWLLARPRRSKELEILVLRHELAILRRQTSRAKLTRADRALLAMLSRSLPRAAWVAFSFKPETLFRWHQPTASHEEFQVRIARMDDLIERLDVLQPEADALDAAENFTG